MNDQKEFAHECKIRNFYASKFDEMRRDERIVKGEHQINDSSLRADLLSIDKQNVLREWEFKIHASYSALGQILTYIALRKEQQNFKPVKGVIAAFDFKPEIIRANEVLNLGIEIVFIPKWMAKAGGIPIHTPGIPKIPEIPHDFPNFS